jgi:hypothetical protein
VVIAPLMPPTAKECLPHLICSRFVIHVYAPLPAHRRPFLPRRHRVAG